jgi:hypothetical protein
MATYSLDEVLANDTPTKKTYSLDEVIGEQPKSRGISEELPRQLGLTARYGAQGLAGTAGLVVDPINALINKATGSNISTLRGATSNLLDRAGFPKPETSRERNVAEASEILVGTGGIVKGAASSANKAVQTIAARPGLQAASAVGSGYAGSEVREQGGSGAEQFGASVLAGIAAPLGVAGLQGVGSKMLRGYNNIANPQQLEMQTENAIRQAGIDPETLPPDALNKLRLDVQNALKTDNLTSPDALSKLADYRALNATPLRGNLTLSPVDITRDKNLAKIGANSRDPAQQSLANIQNANNRALINNLNDLGANAKDDIYGAGQKVISTLQSRDAGAKSIIGDAYNTARNTEGRSASIDPRAFTEQANNLLDDALLGGKLPGDVRNKLNSIAKGKTPLTVDVAEQFKTNIGALQRASTDPAERLALGKVRQALDEAPLLGDQGQGAIDAFNTARRLNASYMKNVEKTPALQAVRDGIEPDKFVQQFIIGNGGKSNVMDVAMLKKNIKGDKQATDAIRGQILSHLKNKALSGAADEVGNFSPSGYKGAFDSIGERKLNLFFDKGEIEQLKRLARVASYENVQPKGSAVNNSGSAAAIFNSVIDGIGKYVPFGELAVKPVQNVGTAIGARSSTNATNAIILPGQRKPIGPMALPLSLGLLSTEE